MSTVILTDNQWLKIITFLRQCVGVYVGNEAKSRRFLEAVLWITRSGSQWRLLPESYGQWNSIYKRFARWCERGIWMQMQAHFASEPDLECLLLDSTVIRAHPCAAGAPATRGGQAEQALGRSRGGFSTKIHIVVDPWAIRLTLCSPPDRCTMSPKARPCSRAAAVTMSLPTKGMTLTLSSP